MMTKKLLRKLVILTCGMALLVAAGCASTQKVPPPNPTSRPQQKPVDAKAQQQYYDQGLQQYSKENYGDAKKAFQMVVELGPKSALGMRAQENLRKIQQILKTLEEIESK
jgi:TolA-binding protein